MTDKQNSTFEIIRVPKHQFEAMQRRLSERQSLQFTPKELLLISNALYDYTKTNESESIYLLMDKVSKIHHEAVFHSDNPQ